jgi:predicted dehydrogenase
MSVPDPARVLLVGAGTRGRVWARVAVEAEQVQLVGIVDADSERAEHTRDELGIEVLVGSDMASVVGDARPDAIVVATPPATHHALVGDALSRGIHVLCEKPLSDQMAAVIDLVEIADQRALQLWVGMNFRYLPASRRIRDYTGSGALGMLSHAQFSYLRHRDGRRPDLNDYPMAMPYPLLLEQSIHHFDLIRYCYRSEVEALVADSWRPSWSTYEDDCCASVLFQLHNGARVNYLGTWTAGANEMCFSWRSDFEGGTLVQRQQFDDLVRVDFRPQLGLSGPRFKTSEEAEPQIVEELDDCTPFVDDSRLLLDEFVRCVHGEGEATTTGSDHIRSLCLVQACMVSVEEGRWVRLDDVYDTVGVPRSFRGPR